MTVKEYDSWAKTAMGSKFRLHEWQRELGADASCQDRLIRIPTGFGKTLGVLLAWLYNRVHRNDSNWPRRLIWCLPMRVLVEQTEAEVVEVLGRLGLHWNDDEPHTGKVGVHRLMGGAGTGDYHLWPEECAVIVGTQDMLLSRALNRGFAAARARWPMDFGLLNQDALWILDEVQLMDIGLATSAQLQAFRRQDEVAKEPWQRACRSWWMSATLQPDWLESIDTQTMLAALPPRIEIPKEQQIDGLWDVTKAMRMHSVASDKDLDREVAELVAKRHQPETLTLVVLNRVETAAAVYTQLKRLSLGAELRLVHSRFRPHERAAWREAFLKKSAPMPSAGRIIVATQVVEAGVDVSATTLITDLAPWPSLVQRFGRCARYEGEKGTVVVLDRGWTAAKDESRALPYALPELLAAKDALTLLKDVSPRALEKFEQGLKSDRRAELYPYEPMHLLLRREWNDLFDTTPDLSGADLGIGRFIRSGEELDVQVFWRNVPETGPAKDWKPSRDELCAVPFRKAQEWLCGKETKEKPARKLRANMRAWVWDWLEGDWKRESQTLRSDIVPGRVVLVDAACGGYSPMLGWSPEFAPADQLKITVKSSPEDAADDAQDSEDLSLSAWKTIATHGKESGQELRNIAAKLGLSEKMTELLALAAETHDIGKSIEFFQGSMVRPDRPDRPDLAKAPDDAWPRNNLYRAKDGERRRGLRHELASTLALFDVLCRCAPRHPALLGEYASLLGVDMSQSTAESADGEWERRVLELADRQTFDLLVYLVAAHHGKVRMSMHAAPDDQEFQPKQADNFGLLIRGIREGDGLPPLYGDGRRLLISRCRLTLEPANVGLSNATGPSWTERTLHLLEQYGPGTLAWLEALVRAADIRASRKTTADPLLMEQHQ
jgi:CRISPR-associated endonuclease/helicase Cas3